jgi:Beta-lactamase
MQRILVMLVVAVLVVVGLSLGALGANWPFWQRAWHWQQASSPWPQNVPGPTVTIHGSASLPALVYRSDDSLATSAEGASTQLLLVGHATSGVRAYFANGFDSQTRIDGRALAAGLMGPLFGTFGAANTAAVLDEPVASWVRSWREKGHGQITPRQLLWQLSGLTAEVFRPFNVASPRAQIASGPDFHRAVTHWELAYPPGSHFAETPVNAQALALVVARREGKDFAMVLQDALWSKFAVGDATGMLDHRRGNMAAHCCLVARADDWLRLGLLLANDGRVQAERVLPRGFVAEMARSSPVHPGYGLGYWVEELSPGQLLLSVRTNGRVLMAAPGTGRALLWVGEGAAPAGLANLMRNEIRLGRDQPISE